jgi:hypothetical protein
MRTDFIFENARFIGLFANRPAYCDSILTRLLSAFVGKFYSGFVLNVFARGFCGLSATVGNASFPRRPRSGRVPSSNHIKARWRAAGDAWQGRLV